MTSDPVEAPAEKVRIPRKLPILPLRDLVVYPFIIVPLSISRDISINAVDRALSGRRMVLLLSQKDAAVDDPTPADLYPVGTVAVIMRLLKLPDDRVRVLVQGVARAEVTGFNEGLPYMSAQIRRAGEPSARSGGLEQQALIRSVKKSLETASDLGKSISSEVMVIANNLEDPGRLADLAASNLDLEVKDAQEILQIMDPVERLTRVNTFLSRELQLLTMQQEINTVAREEMDRSQREFFLRQQMKAIQVELGEGNELAEEIVEIREKASKANLPEPVQKELDNQIRKLERMHPEGGETSMVRSYLDWLLEIPWTRTTEDNLDLGEALRILDEDHFSLEPVKERILEYLAVRKLNPETRGPILCFAGPPGVGKTSLGRSIARAMGRHFIRLSLGGVRDEAEIRGHRRTYIGAMPGRIAQALHQAGTCNPVVLLDEIDKMGADHRGDPSAALLEVLDPEQNRAFRDHYLGLPLDLSRVMFLATANLIEPIQPAFRDRLEVIWLSGYTVGEKQEIAIRHLVPRQMQENGLTPRKISFSSAALRKIINGYTREAGLRGLERELGAVCRKVARRVAEGHKGCVRVGEAAVEKFLGLPKISGTPAPRKARVGVAVGLAWTSAGGEILDVEASAMPGRGNLILTGHLGDVMKESGRAAQTYARSRSADLGLEDRDFSHRDVHIHVPEGAIPKDGPSAGITLAVALISALTGRPVCHDLAMSGEITLRGDVLAVGGIKEKVLAAKRAGLRRVMLPASIRRQVDELPEEARKGVEFIFVDTVEEVLEIALKAPRRGRRAGSGGGTLRRQMRAARRARAAPGS